jgi:hypothetical protein
MMNDDDDGEEEEEEEFAMDWNGQESVKFLCSVI